MAKQKILSTSVCAAGLIFAAATFPAWAAAPQSVPAYKVTAPNGKSNILIGTMHVWHPDLLQPSAEIMAGARQLVQEHTTDNEKADGFSDESRLGLKIGKPVRSNWAQTISEAEVAEISKRLSCINPAYGSPETVTTFLQLKTPRILVNVAWSPCDIAGGQSRDEIVTGYAKAANVPLVYLETQAEVAVQRNKVPVPTYAASLQAGLKIDPNAVIAQTAQLMNAGDYAKIMEIERTSAPTKAMWNSFERPMIIERNHKWLPKLRALFDQGHTVAMVGAGHLPGPKGLVSLLRGAGYKVEVQALPAATKAAD